MIEHHLGLRTFAALTVVVIAHRCKGREDGRLIKRYSHSGLLEQSRGVRFECRSRLVELMAIQHALEFASVVFGVA